MEVLLEILSPSFVLRNAVYASLLTGAIVPLVGIYLVIGQRAILALALPQVGTCGVALAFCSAALLGVEMPHHHPAFFTLAIFSAVALMVAALASQLWLRGRTSSPEESEISALYLLAASGTLAIAASRALPELGLLEIMRGEVLAVSNTLLLWQLTGFSLVALAIFLLRHSFHFVLFNPLLAYTSGLPTGRIAAANAGLVCLTIALGGLCAGPLTIFAFLVLPPLIVLPFVRHMSGMYFSSALVGVAAALGGFYWSFAFEEWNLPISTAQILLLGGAWSISRILALLTYRAALTPN